MAVMGISGFSGPFLESPAGGSPEMPSPPAETGGKRLE